ncbi:MAG: hypothetical protein EOO06_06660 [Chitinophagaceae bacterium]|nr:MAG: hypothetical protein EOO06_06660 [Chitinophagaceae bacterium]
MQPNTSKIKQYFFITCLAILFYAGSGFAQQIKGVPGNHLQLPTKAFNISFRWLGDTVHSKWEPYTAILLPVKLRNCPKTFYLQFDLGHPSTILYKNKMKAIAARYPKAVKLGDSASLHHFAFRLGNANLVATEISVQQFDTTGINWSNQHSMEIIGTAGADLIDGNAVAIDYPARKIRIAPSFTEKITQGISFSKFIYARRSVLFPAQVNGKQTMLYFDTGSSMYELLTDKKTAEQMAVPGAPVQSSQVRSWDKFITARTIEVNATISLAGQSIPIHAATYMEGMSSAQMEGMVKMGIGGMTGNKLFLQYRLLLDTRNSKFALIPSVKNVHPRRIASAKQK